MLHSRFLLLLALAFPAFPSSGTPWDKPAEKWDLADAYRILRDSPWCPAELKLEANYTQRHTDSMTGITTDSPANPTDTSLIRGVELSRSKSLPAVSVFWWSSKTVRLAQQRLLQLRNLRPAGSALKADPLPDHVVVIEGNEPVRILRDAQEDLHETIFLEPEGGMTLDFASVSFLDARDDSDARAEFHFPREVEGHPAIDPQSETIIFHCRASAKTQHLGRQNALSFRAQFHPRAMRVHGIPDL